MYDCIYDLINAQSLVNMCKHVSSEYLVLVVIGWVHTLRLYGPLYTPLYLSSTTK